MRLALAETDTHFLANGRSYPFYNEWLTSSRSSRLCGVPVRRFRGIRLPVVTATVTAGSG